MMYHEKATKRFLTLIFYIKKIKKYLSYVIEKQMLQKLFFYMKGKRENDVHSR